MTSLQPSSSAGADVVEWDQAETGLEDFDSRDLTMPRLAIYHTEGVFRNTQTNETFEQLVVVLLGLHKSRIMWGELSEGDDQDPPLCKSPDTKHGFPNVDDELPVSKRYPWDGQRVFKPGDALPLAVEDGAQTMPSLPCKDCHFKEWNTDPTGKRPWCSEEWTFPLLYQDPKEQDSWIPALLTFRRSGLKAVRQYVTPFATKRQPLFTVATQLSLEINRRGMVKYCTPKLKKVAKTDRDGWQDYFDSFKSAQTFLGQFPMPREPEAGDAVSEEDMPSDDAIQNNDFLEAEVVAAPEEEAKAEAPTTPPAPTPPAPTPPAAPVEEEPTISTKGKVKPVTATAPAAGTVEIDDDEEPPF